MADEAIVTIIKNGLSEISPDLLDFIQGFDRSSWLCYKADGGSATKQSSQVVSSSRVGRFFLHDTVHYISLGVLILTRTIIMVW